MTRLCRPHVRIPWNIYCVGFNCFIDSMVLWPHFDVPMTTCDSVSAGMEMRLAIKITGCCLSSFISTFRLKYRGHVALVPFFSNAPFAECPGTIFRSQGTDHKMKYPMYTVLRNTFSVRFRAIIGQFQTCRSPICTKSETSHWILINSFGTVHNTVDFRRSTRHIQWCFK